MIPNLRKINRVDIYKIIIRSDCIMIMKYCENMQMKNGTFICILNGTELKCKCEDQIVQHRNKWKKVDGS